ncbi:MAG: hypothetical protein R2835_03095 [Thermomicrobiales bacterium]
MDGEERQHGKHPSSRDKDKNERKGGPRSDSDGGSRERNRGRRSGGGGRRGVYAFDDQMEHALCQQMTHQAPKGFPAVGRSDLATMPPVEIDRTETSILFCDQQHGGPHFWPNGDEVR